MARDGARMDATCFADVVTDGLFQKEFAWATDIGTNYQGELEESPLASSLLAGGTHKRGCDFTRGRVAPSFLTRIKNGPPVAKIATVPTVHRTTCLGNEPFGLPHKLGCQFKQSRRAAGDCCPTASHNSGGERREWVAARINSLRERPRQRSNLLVT